MRRAPDSNWSAVHARAHASPPKEAMSRAAKCAAELAAVHVVACKCADGTLSVSHEWLLDLALRLDDPLFARTIIGMRTCESTDAFSGITVAALRVGCDATRFGLLHTIATDEELAAAQAFCSVVGKTPALVQLIRGYTEGA